MELEASLRSSQDSVTGQHPEPFEFSPHFRTPCLNDPFWYYPLRVYS